LSMNGFHELTGERKDQLLVVTDKSGNRIDTATREECHKGDGKPHLAFVAFVIDKDKKIVLTQRSSFKSLWANKWDAGTISHVLPGETVEEAAKRRGREELGIEAEFKNLGAFYYFARHGASCENEYCHVLIGKTDKIIEPNPVEIRKIRKVTYKRMLDELKKNPDDFTPWFKIALEKYDPGGYL
jgi:isopentenyl-diphosphate delta-isomerase